MMTCTLPISAVRSVAGGLLSAQSFVIKRLGRVRTGRLW
jgi:hypothetical protein